MELKNGLDPQNSSKKMVSKMPSQKMRTAPSKTLMTLTAVCFSIVLASAAYRITLSEKTNTSDELGTSVTATTTDPNQIVTSAVEQAQIDTLAGDTEVSSTSNPFDIQPGDTISAKISKKLFSGYFYANQTDGITPDSAASVASAVVGQINQTDLPTAQFSDSEVQTFIPSSKDQIKAYGNIIGGIIVENYKYISDNKPKFSENILEIAKVYKKIGGSIIKQKAPFEIAQNQAALANAFYLLGQGMEMIDVQKTDPVKALLGVKTVKEVESQQFNVLINMSMYFKNNDIIFLRNEPGSFWNLYLNATPDQNNTDDTTTTTNN